MTPRDIYEQLRRDEGLRLTVYKDQRGFNTIGIGHNLDANPLPFDVSLGISELQAININIADVARITNQLLSDIPWMSKLQATDVPRFGIFQNMGFNVGVGGVLEFHHDLADTQAGNYEKAAVDMEMSAWYVQVGPRAKRLCQQMRTGLWV